MKILDSNDTDAGFQKNNRLEIQDLRRVSATNRQSPFWQEDLQNNQIRNPNGADNKNYYVSCKSVSMNSATSELSY